MKKLIKIFLTILFFVILLFVSSRQFVSAQCCCRWYSCGHSGGMYSCDYCYWRTVRDEMGRFLYREYVCEKATSGCDDYSCPCPPPPCNNSCSGSCTAPSCPAGYTTTNPNNLCSTDTQEVSCTYLNGCNNTCTQRTTCYKTESNVAQSIPTSLNMIVDGENYSLSLNSSTPTTVKYPSPANNVQTSIPTRPTPPTSNGLGYAFRANNYGIDNEWLPFDCSRGEDYCVESINNTQNFTPTSLTIPQVLKENAKGQVSGMYYTENLCNTNKEYSLPLETYYKVDNLPIVDIDVCDWDPSLLATDPNCIDPNTGDPEEPCLMLPDQQCTKEEFLPEVGEEDSTSPKGCKTEEYTGTQVNNPLKIRVGSKDIDGNNEIKGTVVWFSKSNNTPQLPNIVSNYTSSSTDELGIMILQDNNSWNNPPLVYGINSNNTWAVISDKTLKNSSGNNIARVSDIEITQGSQIVTFEFNLELIPNLTDNLEGMYNFKSITLDQYMLLSDGRVDISRMQRYFNWGIDLVIPTMIDLSQVVLGPQELYLNWNVEGTSSNITDTVINAYREGFLINDTISLVGYSDITLDNIPPEDQIGLMNDSNSWKISNINTTPYINTNNTRVSINGNEGGSVIMYLTAFDQGCNDNLREHNIDLRPWIATKGGVVYSQGSLGSGAKDVSQVEELDGVLRNVVKEELDTGTELVSSRMDFINNLIHPELGGVRAINTYDSNDRKTYWYEYFKRKLEVQRSTLTEFVIGVSDTKVSDKCIGENCLMYSTENIDIPSGYTCDKNTLFMSEKNIIINPDIYTSEIGIQGCIFIAKGDIEIGEGTYKSGEEKVRCDYIDGFLIAENQIHIKGGDSFRGIRDGLEIYGGLVSFGRDSIDGTAIVIERNLRLFNYSSPTLVTSWDVRHAKLSEIFFGTEAALYKQEVGFKVF